MKTTNKHFVSKLAFAAFLALGTLAVSSCSKIDNQDGKEVPAGESQIIVRIAGVSDANDNNSKGSKSSTSNLTNKSSMSFVEGNGFDAIVGVDNNTPVAQTGLKAASGSRAATSVMTPGTKYRLFLYKNNGGTYTYSKSVELISGSETPIQLPNGSYKWIALSYNNTDPIPDRGADDNLALPENKDVLYKQSAADFVINGNALPIPISINFNRLYSRIAIELNTMGMFAPINSATVTVSGQSTRKASVNLTTGALTLDGSVGIPTINYASFANLGTNGGSQKVAYYYTADPAVQNLSVTVTNLVIQLDSVGAPTGNGTRSFGATSIAVNQAITPTPGQTNRLLVGIAESALTHGAVKWSRSNLYYKPGYNPYRFYHTNPLRSDDNSFFSFGGHIPLVLAKTTAAHDPCQLVYPKGLWKTPSRAQLDAITSPYSIGGLLGDVGLTNLLGIDVTVAAQDLLTNVTPGGTSTATYTEFTPSAGVHAAYGAATSAENKLRFNYNGFMNTLGAVNNIITLNLGATVGQYTSFWTSENLIGTPILSAGVTHFLGHTDTGFLSPNKGAKGYRTTNILSLGLLGGAVDVINSGMMNVRCVRDATWNPSAPGYDPMPVYPN